jgi:hypothetical protein
MSINLIKQREEKVKVCLKKKFTPDTDIVAKVNLILDVSGSMMARYRSGAVQEIVERIYPIASVFDDDKELEMYIFSNGFEKLNSVTTNNYENYVQSEIVNKNRVCGGTYYNKVINNIVTENKNTEVPVYNIFITDGNNNDQDETKETIINSSNEKIFWQFVGIGNEEFYFLKKLDNLNGRSNDNANFFSVNEIANLSDEELYEKLLNEFPSFLENYQNKPVRKGFFGRLFS